MAHIPTHLTVIPVECPYCCHVFDCVVETGTYVDARERVQPTIEYRFEEHVCAVLQRLRPRQ